MVIIDPVKRSRIIETMLQLKPLLPDTDSINVNLPISQTIALARSEVAISWNSILRYKPVTECHHAWMDFACLLTIIYNNLMPQKVYSILRQIFIRNILQILKLGGGGRFYIILIDSYHQVVACQP